MTSSFRAMEVKVKIVLKTQCEQRQKLYQDYSLQVTNLNRKLTTDANQVKKHAEKLSNMFMEQEKFIHESLTLQKNRMEEFKSLCEEYLEKFEVLKDSWGNSITEELRRLIATLERKCLILHRANKRLLLLHSLSWICYSHNTLEGKSRYEGRRNKLDEATCGDVCSFGDYIFSCPPPVPEDAPFC